MSNKEFQRDEEAFSRLLTRDNVALLVVLELLDEESGLRTGQNLIIANTHIHFDPKWSDVKIVQVQMLVEKCEEVKKKYGGSSCGLVVAGDFNSLVSVCVCVK